MNKQAFSQWLDSIESAISSIKVIHNRAEQDQALENLSEKLSKARQEFINQEES